MPEKKLTNKQGVDPDPRKHHHKQGLTCDCRQCGTEFTQFHNRHVYCSSQCMWDHKGVSIAPYKCNDCGCEDTVPNPGRGYVCNTCQKLRLNPDRTDVKRRQPA